MNPAAGQSASVKRTKTRASDLKKQLDSENYKANVSAEEYAKTEVKYKKAKFRLKILKGK
jgi:hypothetical protein